jgi:hypothetical protein
MQIDFNTDTIFQGAVYVPERYSQDRGRNSKLECVRVEIACELKASLEHCRQI